MSEGILATSGRDKPRTIVGASEIEDDCEGFVLPWQVAGEVKGAQDVNERGYGTVRAGWTGGEG